MNTSLRPTVAAFALALAALNLSAATLYVSLESTNPVPPFATWASAANVIQDAVDAAQAGDTVLVTNGVYGVGTPVEYAYASGVIITNSIRLESVNGPLLTTIHGNRLYDANGYVRAGVRCVYLGANAVISGLTLTNGYAARGGGIQCEPSAVVTNCILSGNGATRAFLSKWGGGGVYGGTLYDCTLDANSADFQGGYGGFSGGGACGSTLYNCTLTGNSAAFGGGASDSTLYNCTLTGNSGWEGAGVADCTLYNCMVTGNSAGGASGGTLYNCTVTGNAGGGVLSGRTGGSTVFNSIIYYNSGGNYGEGTVLHYCLTSPLPTNGVGNVTGPPLFMDMAGGDFRLREDSPCVDAGADVNLLNVGYNYDPTDILGNTRFIDGNGDGKVAWDIGAYEFNSFKPPRLAARLQPSANGFQFTVTGEPGRSVRIERSRDLTSWEPVATVPIPASGQTLIDPAATTEPFLFYRAVSVP